jgi:manganese oxidase
MRWTLAVVVVVSLVVAAAAQAATAPLRGPSAQGRSFTLYVREGWVPLPDGSQVYVWGFTDDPNGPPQVPGPPIVVNEGDTVEVTLVNDRDPTASDRLPTGEGHTIHLHGLDVPTEFDGVPETHADGLVRQGSRYTYRFVASHAGTYWYHCHQNNVEHQQMGMYGPVIVRAAGGAKTAYTGGPAFDREQTLVLAEMGVAGHEQARRSAKDGALPYNWLRYTPDFVFTNDQPQDGRGDVWANAAARPGERVLVRAINAGYVIHQLHAHGQPFQVVASDGRPWPQGPTTDSVWVGPGERYDLLVTADASGRVALHDHVAEAAAPPRAPAPAAAAPTGTTRQYTLYVRETLQTMPDGAEIYGYGFTDDPDGPAQVPGPVLQVAEGDTVEVTLVNDRDPTGQGHALALPGLGMPVEGPDRVAPGQSGVYRFLAGRAGSYLYASPDDGHRQMGLYGALVVTPTDGARRVYGDGPSFDEQYTMVLSEVDAPGHAATRRALHGNGAPYDWAASTPNYFLINGRAYPDTERDLGSMVHAEPGTRVLVRAVNAGQRPHAMHLHGYHFHVVDVDGRPQPGWPAKDTVLIWPGESANLLFVADQPGRFPFHDHFETANTNDGVWLGGMHTMVATGVEHATTAPTAGAPALAGAAASSAVEDAAAIAVPEGAAADAAGPTVFVRDNFYAPNQLTVPAGTTVRWQHEGQVEHTVSSLLGYFDSGPLTNGNTFTYTFATPGRYDYFCRFHLTNRGTIVVQ